jgi:CBS domain-containing protein
MRIPILSQARHVRQSTTEFRRGSVVVETCICLVGVIVVGLLVFGQFGASMETTFGGVAAAMSGESASIGRATASTRSTDSNALGETATTGSTPDGFPTYSIGLAAALVGVTILLTALRLTRRKRSSDETIYEHEEVSVPKDLRPKFIAHRQRMLNLLSGELPGLVRGEVLVRHLMSGAPITVSDSTTTEEVRGIMEEKHIRHVLVTDDKNRLLGIVSDRDVKNHREGTTGQWMSRRLVTITSDSKMCAAVSVLLQHGISCLPVIDDGQLKGVITSVDIMLATQCMLRLFQNMANQLQMPEGLLGNAAVGA